MKRVAFCTLGCKVNQYETNAMEKKFINNGYEIVNFENFADIYIINTCTVTNMSDRKSRQMIRRAKRLNRNALVVAAGCYAQIEGNKLEEINELDLVLGNNEKNNIVKYIEEYKNKKTIAEDIMKMAEFNEWGSTTLLEKTRAVIKVQDGCDRYCSYCIIPYARGRVRSRKVENIIEEISELAKKDIKEVVITGIHIASYGKDFKEDIQLIDLVEKINSIEGIERVRLGSLEPTIITKEFIERLSKLDKVCHHFHLSLQSGCNDTLKRMNRRYTIEEFESIVKLLRTNYKDVILTTDIIVGFPEETDEEFKCTYKFLEKIKFYKMHVFKYSRRSGTKADLMEGQISEGLKEKRSKKIMELSNKIQKDYNKEYIGKEVEVLFEEENNGYIKGHSKNYIVVNAKKNTDVKNNEILKVKIDKIEDTELYGKIKNDY